ncbi:HAD-like protein [Teratosphaeria nubilosa]|uniref:HAD-like protein n=1 Tax=Teratosphaeria nubilosa TaxID=161662 RepID=A0A6G1KZU2_9PEZI|nr:HAD-like protein [Teratosphaeria nubilosa]
MGKVKYILLDCDNTLCQSERLAFEACADLTNELLGSKNIPDRYTTDSLLEDFVGNNFRNMLLGLQKKHNFTVSDEEMEDYVGRELGRVTQKLSEKCIECPGVTQQLEWAKAQGYPMSVVSTSAKPRIIASLQKTNLLRFFDEKHVYSAATSMPKPSSKPDPAIYLFACEKLGVKPEETLTVEDSKSGATAAMRAGIPLIGYVGIYGIEDGKEKEEQMAKTLTDVTKASFIMRDWKEFPEAVRMIESQNSS